MTAETAKPVFSCKRALVVLACIMLCMALWPGYSYTPEDMDYFAGGMTDPTYPRNLIGYVGAHVSWALLITFGLGAYALVALVLLCALRRMLCPWGLRPVTWEYYAAFLLFALGSASLLGIWPDFCDAFLQRLNIATLPGGLVGYRLGSPEIGWIRLLFNPTGGAIISCAFIAVSLGIIGVFDWQCVGRAIGGLFHKSTKDDEMDADNANSVPPFAQAEPTPKPASGRRQQEPLPTQAPVFASTPSEPESEPERPAAQPTLPFMSQSPKAAAKPAATTATATVPTASHGAASTDGLSNYELPPIDILDPPREGQINVKAREIEENKYILQNTLDNLHFEAQVMNAVPAPQVTLFEIQPAPGINIKNIEKLDKNICMELRATSVRILAPIPGKPLVGIEVPNKVRSVVTVREMIQDPSWEEAKRKMGIPLLLGRNINGNNEILDLAEAPHLLIAGATGSGKSVCMNLLITSMLYRFRPDELKFIMVDPKVVEFAAYESLPHLIVPVVNDVKKVALAINWAINEMERRYRLLKLVNVNNLKKFNSRTIDPNAPPIYDEDGNEVPAKLPYIVLIIDELADIMATVRSEVETGLARIAAKSRAIGIHTIIATQRPDVKVITGVIKANFPVRIAFAVTSQIDSRTILDGKGAESLMGYGDMLYRPKGTDGLKRVQGGMASDKERDAVVKFVSDQAPQEFDDSILAGPEGQTAEESDGGSLPESSIPEALLLKAIEAIGRTKNTSVSNLQRCLGVGYNKAASIAEELERRGVLGPKVGNVREILALHLGGSGNGGDGMDNEDADLSDDDEP